MDKLLAEILLTLGMFVRGENGVWKREIDEESSYVTAEYGDHALTFHIGPSVSQPQHHAQRRIAAGVYFELACKYAEKVGGKITQHSNITGCIENGSRDKVLAAYPDTPLDWTRICAGFQAVLLAAPHEGEML